MLTEYVVETSPSPSGGPIVLEILNIMEGYGFNETDDLYFHRLVEAIKFAYAAGESLADPEFDPNSIEVAKQMGSK